MRTRRAAVSPVPLAFLLTGLLLPFAPRELVGQTGDHPDLPVTRHELANGLRILVLPRDTSPTVSFVVRIPVGSMHESLGRTGIAHVLEHLLFKGTTTIGTTDVDAELRLFEKMDAAFDSLRHLRGVRLSEQSDSDLGPEARAMRDERARLEERIRVLEDSARAYVVPNEFDEILSRNGARGLNASTSYEATEYQVELPANRAELWFALEGDRMRNPVFREFHRERDVVEEERRARLESDPAGRLWEEHTAAAFRVHPYGVAPIGHMDDIRNLTRADVTAFHDAHYGPGNTVVAIVGAIDPDSAIVWAERYLAPVEPRAPPPLLLVSEPEQRGERRIEVVADAEPQIRIGWKIGGGDDAELPALAMLANILVGGRDTRLHRRLVRDERLASSVSVGLSPGGRDPGLLVIHAVPLAPHTPEEVEAAIHDEIARIVTDPPTPFELERIRTWIDASRARRLVSNLGLAYQLADSESTWGDWRRTFVEHARLGAVTPDDIVAVVERRLRAGTRTVAILRREGGG